MAERDFWVATKPLDAGGRILAGPYSDEDAAINARNAIEERELLFDLWVIDTPSGDTHVMA